MQTDSSSNMMCGSHIGVQRITSTTGAEARSVMGVMTSVITGEGEMRCRVTMGVPRVGKGTGMGVMNEEIGVTGVRALEESMIQLSMDVTTGLRGIIELTLRIILEIKIGTKSHGDDSKNSEDFYELTTSTSTSSRISHVIYQLIIRSRTLYKYEYSMKIVSNTPLIIVKTLIK